MGRKLRRQGLAAGAVGLVGLTLIGLSLDHLAAGIELTTHSAPAEAWTMAVGIDLGFVACELADLSCSTAALQRHIAKLTRPAIAGTMIGSAVLNAWAFAADATGYGVYAAIALGVAIPALVCVLTKIATDMFQHKGGLA
jgi:hypothetical protein